jgi:hypothetical protein
MPNFLGKNEKKTFITFPSRLKFPKLPESFPRILEKKSHEYFRAQDLLDSQIFGRKWKKMDLYNLPEIYQAKYRFSHYWIFFKHLEKCFPGIL